MLEAALHKSSQGVPRSPGRAFAVSIMVFLAAALALRGVDAIPSWFSGLPRTVRACATLEEAEELTGVELGAVWSAFRGWHPVAIRATRRPVAAIAVTLRNPVEAETELAVYRSLDDRVPESLCPPLPSFHAINVPLPKGRTATLKAEALSSGGVLQELEWTAGREHSVVRFTGRTVELLRLGRLLAEKDP